VRGLWVGLEEEGGGAESIVWQGTMLLETVMLEERAGVPKASMGQIQVVQDTARAFPERPT